MRAFRLNPPLFADRFAARKGGRSALEIVGRRLGEALRIDRLPDRRPAEAGVEQSVEGEGSGLRVVERRAVEALGLTFVIAHQGEEGGEQGIMAGAVLVRRGGA